MQNKSNAESSQESFMHYLYSALGNHLPFVIFMIPNLLAVIDKSDCTS